MGAGQPRDPLDRHCKEYKECQRCARDRFGDECVPEIVKYEWKNSTSTTSSVDHLQCGDAPSTCERALCECDKESLKQFLSFLGNLKFWISWKLKKAFSSTLSARMSDYNNEYSIWSRRWDREIECVKTGTGQGERKCCGLETGPYFIYHERRHQCCDGTVSAPGTC